MTDPKAAQEQQRQQLRTRFRAARRSISTEQQEANAIAATDHYVSGPLSQLPGVIALFMSQDGELNTRLIVEHCQRNGTPIALPVVSTDKHMHFLRYLPGESLAPGAFGILEPAPNAPPVSPWELAVLFMPLVAFDDSGNRMGMGGGYYDRYLGAVPPQDRPLLVGLCHATQRSNEPLPAQPWDIPLDAALTNEGLTLFSNRCRTALHEA